MTKQQISLEKALELVDFKEEPDGIWSIETVYVSVGGNVHGNVEGHVGGFIGGYVYGSVNGSVRGDVEGDVSGSVKGSVKGDVYGTVYGDVLGDADALSTETPKERFQRLLQRTGDTQLINAFNEL